MVREETVELNRYAVGGAGSGQVVIPVSDKGRGLED